MSNESIVQDDYKHLEDFHGCKSIIKYLTFMTKGDLSIAIDLGYLNEEQEVTSKGYLELKDVAHVKVYPMTPKLSALDKLFND